MDSIYLEYMVKRERVPMDWIKRIGLVLGLIILNFLVLNFFSFAFPILLALSAWGGLIVWRRMDKEFEYIYTDGLLDVDCVYHASTRKSMISLDCREFEIVAPASDPRYQSLFDKNYNKVLDAGRGGIRENTYIAICARENNTLKMLFEPNDAMLEAMKRYIPRTLILPDDKRR
ncbi:MAG: hypothetical protein K6A77_02785 [Clostridiales bacterium]|nr:hypothetical protein [Clostridiales bacterium]